jgi:hypothetical protein
MNTYLDPKWYADALLIPKDQLIAILFLVISVLWLLSRLSAPADGFYGAPQQRQSIGRFIVGFALGVALLTGLALLTQTLDLSDIPYLAR